MVRKKYLEKRIGLLENYVAALERNEENIMGDIETVKNRQTIHAGDILSYSGDTVMAIGCYTKVTTKDVIIGLLKHLNLDIVKNEKQEPFKLAPIKKASKKK